MQNYELKIENGVITWVEDTDVNGNPIPGVLYIPKEAVDFSTDAWVHLGCEADGIVVHYLHVQEPVRNAAVEKFAEAFKQTKA